MFYEVRFSSLLPQYTKRYRQLFAENYVPGAIGRITELHGTYYQQHADFNPSIAFSDPLRGVPTGHERCQ